MKLFYIGMLVGALAVLIGVLIGACQKDVQGEEGAEDGK